VRLRLRPQPKSTGEIDYKQPTDEPRALLLLALRISERPGGRSRLIGL
jgi:hypothetical protein